MDRFRGMANGQFVRLDLAIDHALMGLKEEGEAVDAGRWQGVPTSGKPDLQQRELLNVRFSVPMLRSGWTEGLEGDWLDQIAAEIQPNREWADEHFAERVGGVPLNPDPSHERWPWWRGQSNETMVYGKFSHTYSERFWPKNAGDPKWRTYYDEDHWDPIISPASRVGIHFEYGDYGDVLSLLAREPFTRQAYLPIFFPEDTGAVHGGRIPCSLGYHFMLRRSLRGHNFLHCWYDIRSCDAVRHFRDDVYLAARLCGHTINQLAEGRSPMGFWEDVLPGNLYFTAHSFHAHMGDFHLLQKTEHE